MGFLIYDMTTCSNLYGILLYMVTFEYIKILLFIYFMNETVYYECNSEMVEI